MISTVQELDVQFDSLHREVCTCLRLQRDMGGHPHAEHASSWAQRIVLSIDDMIKHMRSGSRRNSRRWERSVLRADKAALYCVFGFSKGAQR